uniref:DNA 3'-5' helicase n=1 Tax=Pseudo-nitzschia australis TaxID=44445 RepID=A0A7S4AC05_9STRA
MVLPQMKNRCRRRKCLSGTTRSLLLAEGRLFVAVVMILAIGAIVRRQNPSASSVFLRTHVDCLRTPNPTTSIIRRRNSVDNNNNILGRDGRLFLSRQQPMKTGNKNIWFPRRWQNEQCFTTNRRILLPLSSLLIPEISSGGDGDDDVEDDGIFSEDYGNNGDSTSSEQSAEIRLRDLNPSQIEAVTQPLRVKNHGTGGSTSVVTRVIAGPGSGKTKVLTTRIAHLLNEDPYGKILAVTFTRKAAGEMKERLERLLIEQEKAVRSLENANQNHIYDDDGQTIVQENTQGQVDLEGSTNPKGIERVELGTFHSICAKILRFNGELLRNLPSVQRDMSMAQPVLMEKISSTNSNEEDEGAEPEMIMVDPEINLNGQYVIIDQAEQIRILNECLKQQEIDLKKTAMKPIQIISTIGKMKDSFAQGQDPFVDQKNRRGGPGRPGETMKMARKVYFPYREKLLMNNALDFDDLILMTRELLMVDEELRQRLHKRWPHVLVDEYQDTSKVQMDLIKLLTSSSLFVVGDADQSIYSWRGAHVGSLEDVKTEFEAYGMVQTVFLKENYRSTSNIVRAAEKVISSSQPTSVIGEALAEAGVSEEDSEKDDLRRAMKPKRGAGPSPRVVACEDERAEAKFVVDTILNMTANDEISPRDTVAMIYRTNAQSRYLEEACVQKNLPYVIRGGAGGFYKRAEIKDCLCFLRWLYSGNDEGSMIRAMKTPSKGIGEKGFGEFKEYCELVQSYIRQNYPDSDRPTYLDILISMTNGEEGGSSDRDYTLPDGTPEAVDHISKRAQNNFLKFSSQMREIRAKGYKEDVGKLLLFIIEKLKLIDHLDTISKSKTEFLERKENVQELRNAAKRYASYGPALIDGPASPEAGDDVMGVESALSNFLDDVALVSDTAEANEEDPENPRLVVNLMTIHASKGTEFDCVFVVGLEEGTLPCNPALQEGAGSVQLEEEKRLCYVAMTRAKTRLILTWRKEVTSFSNWSDKGPNTQSKQRSRFLNAIVSRKSKARSSKKRKQENTNARQGISLRKASTSARSSSRGINRSGLTGPNGRRNPYSPVRRSPPARREFSPSGREQPRNLDRKVSGTRGKQNQQTYRPSVERVEELKSTLGSPSRATPPRKASSSSSPPKKNPKESTK